MEENDFQFRGLQKLFALFANSGNKIDDFLLNNPPQPEGC